MPFSSGVFSRVYNWVTDKNSSIDITAARMDTEDNGFATGLSSCILKDGTQTITNDIPFNNHKITGLANGTASTDAAAFGQIQGGSTNYCGTSGGTANAQTLTPTPALAAYVAGNIFSFLPVATNTSGTVTIANSGLATRNVKKSIGGAKCLLAVGDIIIAIPCIVEDDGTDYVLMNPQTYSHGADVASATTTVLDTTTGDMVDVTGTTTITAITLAEGKCRTVRFTGALTLTNGASLILPGSANITTAAGDYAIFRGYASSVVRCVMYSPLTGQSPAFVSPLTTTPPSFRNAFINGDMSVAQRGTTFTGINGTTFARTLDGWFAWADGTSNMSVSQQTGLATNGFNYILRFGRPLSDTSIQIHRVGQIIETRDVYRFQGQSINLTFYARSGANFSAASGNIVIRRNQGTGADEGAASMIAATWTGQAQATITKAITSTLTRYTIPNFSAIAAGTTEVAIDFSFTPVGTAGAADYVEITGVQLEIAGTGLQSPYEFLPIQVQFARCQRLLPGWNGAQTYNIGQCINTTVVAVTLIHPVPARIIPTALVNSTASGFSVSNSSGGAVACTGVAINSPIGTQSTLIQMTVASGLTAGNASIVWNSNAGAQLLLTGAEL